MSIMRKFFAAACLSVFLASAASAIDPPEFMLAWGSYGSGDGQFNQTIGCAVDAGGDVYVVDHVNHRVQKFTSEGTFITKWGSYGGSSGQFRYPGHVAVDGIGQVFVADQGPSETEQNHRIEKFTGTGAFLSEWGEYGSADGQFWFPVGVACDAAGNVYVADSYNHRIQKFGNNGAFLSKWGEPGSDVGQFNLPRGIAMDAASCVYVVDRDNHRVQKFTGTGAFVTAWGSPGSGDGQFNMPQGIAVDASGWVYVADTHNDRIQVFTDDGVFLVKWGATGTADGQFDRPAAVAVAASGHVYVCDRRNHRVQKFAPLVRSITVDATALTPQMVKIYGFGSPFLSNVTQEFELPAGSYRFMGAENEFVFRVTASGLLDFEPELDTFLSGRHATTLVVDGLTISVDSSSLSPQNREIKYVPGVIDEPYTLIPGQYTFRGADNEFTVTLTREGTFDFATELDGFLGGRGTGLLQVHGFDLLINSTVLIPLTRYVYGVQQSADEPFTLIPGDYRFHAGDAEMLFRLGDDGLVSDLPAMFLGYPVAGNGTNLILIGESAVTVSGTVSSDCHGPLAGVTVDLLGEAGDFLTASTNPAGHYTFADLSLSMQTAEISLVIPLGFAAETPTGGETTIVLDQDRVVDFALLCLPTSGNARSKGYWKHQASVYVNNRGSAQESETDMRTTFPQALFYHFHENQLASIEVNGVTFMDGLAGPVPLDLDAIQETLQQKASMLEKAKQQYLALLLNVASGKVASQQPVSADGATTSQAMQHVAALVNDELGDHELAKDICETINHGEQVETGLIPLALPIVAYRSPGRALAPLHVAPNPGGAGLYTFSFALQRAGQARLEIFDVAGRRVAVPLLESLDSGLSQVTWNGCTVDGKRVGQGVYFARLRTAAGTRVVKFVHLRR